ncbi:endo-1,3;1,4-beta-D-glucanase-like isoform X2 [Mangifera indica]|uniref:endo-1,3;1,4-beta-D-glucanase-like isoform X2 n=1 Tax=Mangifera indica TaxID=29780 RepID=UPI001CFBCAEA|nr:endo-1,3;1,4-beta-D-glucanase-like isoform X2 [Mangifera indica]
MAMASSQCLVNPPILSPTCGAGTVQELAGLKTYVTGPSDSKLAILFLSDGFGYEAPLFRKLADKVAASGFLVVAPDFFYGEPVDVRIPHFDGDAWVKAHDTDKGYEDAKPVIGALKSKGVSAIGAAGFCWGGKVAVKLASTNDIQAAVLLHPTWVTVDDIKEVKIPVAILGAEIDLYCPVEQVKQFAEILSIKSVCRLIPLLKHSLVSRMDGQ